MLRQALGATAGSGGIVSALLAAGWTGVVLLAVVFLVVVGAVCWVVNSPERPQRLALLITSWRSSRNPARPAVRAAKPKPASTASARTAPVRRRT